MLAMPGRLSSQNEKLDANPVSCMALKTSDTDHLAASKEYQKELLHYLELFAGAFDELHGAIIMHTNTPDQHIGPHHDYPAGQWLPFFP
jgi:hypothetical protein